MGGSPVKRKLGLPLEMTRKTADRWVAGSAPVTIRHDTLIPLAGHPQAGARLKGRRRGDMGVCMGETGPFDHLFTLKSRCARSWLGGCWRAVNPITHLSPFASWGYCRYLVGGLIRRSLDMVFGKMCELGRAGEKNGTTASSPYCINGGGGQMALDSASNRPTQ